MPVPIIIFSKDAVRGRVILNALRFKGFEALFYDGIINADNVIGKNTPSVVIFDTKGVSQNELDYFKLAYPILSNSSLIVLVNPSEVHNLELQDIRAELCRPDPLDIELIISKVKALLSSGIKEPGGEESGDDEQRLEDDLKKFLDLE